MVKEIQIELSDKKVTAWGGMKLMKDMLDSIGIKDLMAGLDLPEKGGHIQFMGSSCIRRIIFQV
jgi:hypothetical protein